MVFLKIVTQSMLENGDFNWSFESLQAECFKTWLERQGKLIRRINLFITDLVLSLALLIPKDKKVMKIFKQYL